MATGAQIKAEVELMLDEQAEDEPLRMSELQRELESRLGLERQHEGAQVRKDPQARARARGYAASGGGDDDDATLVSVRTNTRASFATKSTGARGARAVPTARAW